MSDDAKQDDVVSLEGTVPDLATPQQRREAFDLAFDYRGDVTISTDDGRVIQGYVFDRRSDIDGPYVRLIPRDGDQRISVPYARIVGLRFTGRDTAAGKSWESWVRKYQEKKVRGERASIESEPLDE